MNASEGSNTVSVAVYLNLGQRSQFVVVNPAVVDGQYELNRIATIHAPPVGFKNNTLLVIVS